MPRIRTIKPEFWSDEKLAILPAFDRLVFLGLIGMADDFGRVHDNVKVIDAFVFPETQETVRESLANLSRIGRVRRGNASNGKPIIEIVNWERHQRVDKPQKHLSLPPIVTEAVEIEQKTSEIVEKSAIRESFANRSRIVPEDVATLPGTRDQGSGTMDRDHGSWESEGEQDAGKPRSSASADKQVPVLHREILDSWNAAMNRNDRMTPKRVAALRQRLRDDIWVESWAEAIRRASESPFCLGNNDQGWLAHFEWFIRPDTVTNILEGKYDHREPKKSEPEFVF